VPLRAQTVECGDLGFATRAFVLLHILQRYDPIAIHGGDAFVATTIKPTDLVEEVADVLGIDGHLILVNSKLSLENSPQC